MLAAPRVTWQAVLLAALGLPTLGSAGTEAPPQVLFKELFVAVQTEQVFADSKTFPDSVPKAVPWVILGQYRQARPGSVAALREFVATHFTLPSPALAPPSAAMQVPIIAHIDGLWDTLTRSTPSAAPYASLLPLPHPYVVPGGRFRELYYWDSYFTMLGLATSGRQDLVDSMVSDFAYLVDTYGHVPNGARTYYLSRSQPPFFFEMVALTAPEDPAGAFARYLPELKREHAFWMQGESSLRPGDAHRRIVAMPDGSTLNRYWDDRHTPRDESYLADVSLARASGRRPSQVYRELRAAAESGWDFSSRWLADAQHLATIETTQIVPIDLNSLLFGLESAIRAGCARRGDQVCALRFAQRAARRHAAIDRYLWDGAAGSYFDYQWRRQAPLRRVSAATLYPLFLGLASAAQATSVARTTARELLRPGGIVTTPLRTGQQWDAPNGWAPLQWIAIAGLRRYGEDPLAGLIACRWLSNVQEVYQHSGKLVEKYDVIETGRQGGGGEYPLQDGFGWTNGIVRKLSALYPAMAGQSGTQRCPARVE